MDKLSLLLFLSIFTSGFCWAGFILGVYSTTAVNWIKFQPNGTSGLWNNCTNKECMAIAGKQESIFAEKFCCYNKKNYADRGYCVIVRINLDKTF